MVVRSFVRHASTAIRKTTGRGAGRNQIVSQGLCDDVVERLRSSFPTPGTCDLIDINPGVGVWSRTLHAALQPRRHVLVEPHLERHGDDLSPLLNHASSRYRVAATLQEALDPVKGHLSQYDTEKGATVAKLPRFNEALLLTVNLSGRNISRAGYQGTLAKKFFDDLYFSLFSRSELDLFRYGLVRLLAWMPMEMGREPFLPRTVLSRSKQIITLEAFTDIVEVAGLSVNAPKGKFRRWPKLEMEEIKTINANHQHGDLRSQSANSRTDPSPPFPDLKAIEPTPSNLRNLPFASDATWVPRYLRLDEMVKREDPAFYREPNGRKEGRHADTKNALQREWLQLRRLVSSRHRTFEAAVDLVDRQRQLVRDWKAAVQKANAQPLEPWLEQQLRGRGDALYQDLRKLNLTDKAWAEKAIDDCRAVDMSPPILAWSRRQNHPLVVHDNDFALSQRQMALLDVTPHAGLLSKLDNYDKMVCYRHVMTVFSHQLSKSVFETLKMLVYDTGVDSFVKTLPGIHDPTKGGWYDLKQLRLRALPADMFIEIALAFERWPFRPRTETMLLASLDPQNAWVDAKDRLK